MFEATPFSDDDDAGSIEAEATEGSHGHTSAAVVPEMVAQQSVAGFHAPSDSGFSPVTVPLSVTIAGRDHPAGAAAAARGPGLSWTTRECHCLRCEVLRLASAIAAANDVIAEVVGGLGAVGDADDGIRSGAPKPPQPRPRAEDRSARKLDTSLVSAAPAQRQARASQPPAVPPRVPAVSPERCVLIVDLDNFGFPQLKQPAPTELLQLVAWGRVLLWCFHGAGFESYFGTTPARYLDDIGAKRDAAVRGMRRTRAAAGMDTATQKKRKQVDSNRGSTSATPSSSSRETPSRNTSFSNTAPRPSCWSVLKGAACLHVTPCGAENQAADTVVLDAVRLCLPEWRTLVATGDRGLQQQVRELAHQDDPQQRRLCVIGTKEVASDVGLFWRRASDWIGSPSEP